MFNTSKLLTLLPIIPRFANVNPRKYDPPSPIKILDGGKLNIRKARFMQGVKESEKQNARKDVESKAKIVEVASKVARQEKKRD